MKRKNMKKLINQVRVAGAIGDYADVWNLSKDVADNILNLGYDNYMECADMLEMRAEQLYIENIRTPIHELIMWIHNDMGTDYCADLLCASGIELRVKLDYTRELYWRRRICNSPVVCHMVEKLTREILENVSRETSDPGFPWREDYYD